MFKVLLLLLTVLTAAFADCTLASFVFNYQVSAGTAYTPAPHPAEDKVCPHFVGKDSCCSVEALAQMKSIQAEARKVSALVKDALVIAAESFASVESMLPAFLVAVKPNDTEIGYMIEEINYQLGDATQDHDLWDVLGDKVVGVSPETFFPVLGRELLQNRMKELANLVAHTIGTAVGIASQAWCGLCHSGTRATITIETNEWNETIHRVRGLTVSDGPFNRLQALSANFTTFVNETAHFFFDTYLDTFEIGAKRLGFLDQLQPTIAERRTEVHGFINEAALNATTFIKTVDKKPFLTALLASYRALSQVQRHMPMFYTNIRASTIHELAKLHCGRLVGPFLRAVVIPTVPRLSGVPELQPQSKDGQIIADHSDCIALMNTVSDPNTAAAVAGSPALLAESIHWGEDETMVAIEVVEASVVPVGSCSAECIDFEAAATGSLGEETAGSISDDIAVLEEGVLGWTFMGTLIALVVALVL